MLQQIIIVGIPYGETSIQLDAIATINGIVIKYRIFYQRVIITTSIRRFPPKVNNYARMSTDG